MTTNNEANLPQEQYDWIGLGTLDGEPVYCSSTGWFAFLSDGKKRRLPEAARADMRACKLHAGYTCEPETGEGMWVETGQGRHSFTAFPNLGSLGLGKKAVHNGSLYALIKGNDAYPGVEDQMALAIDKQTETRRGGYGAPTSYFPISRDWALATSAANNMSSPPPKPGCGGSLMHRGINIGLWVVDKDEPLGVRFVIDDNTLGLSLLALDLHELCIKMDVWTEPEGEPDMDIRGGPAVPAIRDDMTEAEVLDMPLALINRLQLDGDWYVADERLYQYYNDEDDICNIQGDVICLYDNRQVDGN